MIWSKTDGGTNGRGRADGGRRRKGGRGERAPENFAQKTVGRKERGKEEELEEEGAQVFGLKKKMQLLNVRIELSCSADVSPSPQLRRRTTNATREIMAQITGASRRPAQQMGTRVAAPHLDKTHCTS